MYTKQALRNLGVADSSDHRRSEDAQLDRQGFFIVENVLGDGDLARMRIEFERIHAKAERVKAATRFMSSRARAASPTSSTRPTSSTNA